ncbi:MAG: IS1634 family transposase [Alphaproteobacteria bacterium]|nr:IS1634 family transposase [Alphaproteobacteria bacterium]
MYVERVPNRNSPPAVLLRESYRDGDKVKKRTLANLSDWPTAKVEALRRVLRGELDGDGAPPRQGLRLLRSLPHGHVAAALGMARKLGLDRVLAQDGRQPARLADLCLGMIAARLVDPGSKLATARQLDQATATSSLGLALGLDAVDEQDLYGALDWLLAQQPRIERALARRHLEDGTLVLYDVTSTWFEGRTCPLARLGYSRDGKPGKLQILFGLLCTAEGCPVAVEVFEGNVGDPATLKSQIGKLKHRFKLDRVVLVGDRGMITAARIEEALRPAGLDWITALRAPAIRGLAEAGPLQLSLFDQRDMAEIASPDYPGERLVACRNPQLAAERARKRAELLDATERQLARVQAQVRSARRPLRGKDRIGLAVGAVADRYKMAKHFAIAIAEDDLTYARKQDQIDAEAALDGIYVLRTSLAPQALDAAATVAAYKGLAGVERAFRSCKTVDLEVRPIHHRLAERVRAHVFLCMLAYYVEWHMRRALAPILFDDHDKPAAAAERASIVAPARRSPAARRKAATKRTEDGLPVHSFRSLLAELATLTRNTMDMADQPDASFVLYPEPTQVQARAFALLGLPHRL